MDIVDYSSKLDTLYELLANKTLSEASSMLKKAFDNDDLKVFMSFQEQLMQSFIDAFSKFAEENFYLSGMSHLFDQPEFDNTGYMKKFVELLDRRDLVKMIGHQEGLQVRFGSDLQLIPMENCTLISIPYHISEDERGTIAVITVALPLCSCVLI